MAFKEIAIDELSFNPFDKIAKQWMLITAGNKEGSNTMTASWGGLGIMWGKKVAFVLRDIQKNSWTGQRFSPFLSFRKPSGKL